MGKFVIRQTATGYKFDLKASNGETVATSQVYKTCAACEKGAKSVAKYAPNASCADFTEGAAANNPKFELYQDRAGEFRFRLRSRNGKVIAVSEGYRSRSACVNGIESVRKNADNAQVITQFGME